MRRTFTSRTRVTHVDPYAAEEVVRDLLHGSAPRHESKLRGPRSEATVVELRLPFLFAKTTPDDIMEMPPSPEEVADRVEHGNTRTGKFEVQLLVQEDASGEAQCIPLPNKEVSAYGLDKLEKFVRSVRHPRLRLRCDGEHTTLAWRTALIKRMPGIIQPEQTPRYSHQCNPAERAIQDIETRVRTIRLDVKARYGIDVHSDHDAYPWLCMYAA